MYSTQLLKNAINGYVMDHCRHSHLPIHPFNFQVKYVQSVKYANSHKLKTNERCILKSALTRDNEPPYRTDYYA